MKKALFLLAVLCGCMPNQTLSVAADASVNVDNLSRIAVGMTQTEVLKIMRHPYSDQVFLFDQDTYDVWFYVTGRVVLGQSRMVPQNLTPLTFKNGILIGKTYGSYNFLKRQQIEAEKAKFAPQVPEMRMEPEDKGMEKTLQELKGPTQPKAVQPKPPQQEEPKKEKEIDQKEPIQPPVKVPPQPTQRQAIQPAPPENPQNKQQQRKQEPPVSQTPAEPPPVRPTSSPQTMGQPNDAGTQNQKPGQTAPNRSPAAPPGQPQNSGQPKEAAKPGKKDAQPGQTAPDWSPLERQQQPPPQPRQEGPPKKQTSMSQKPKNPKEGEEEKKNEQPQKNKSLPLDESDDEFLEKERFQDFNQTLK